MVALEFLQRFKTCGDYYSVMARMDPNFVIPTPKGPSNISVLVGLLCYGDLS